MIQAPTVATEPVADRHRSVAGRTAGPRPRPRPNWMAPLGIIAAELVLIGLLIRNSYYATDDWIIFSIAKSNGLSWKTVGYNLYNHFAPIEWLLHLLVQDLAPLDYTAGMAIILVLCAGMLLALWWTLNALEAPRVIVLGGILIVGTSLFLVNSALWFGEALFIPLFVTGMVLVVGFFARWCRYGRRRDAVIAWLVFSASLLAGEIPLLVLPLLVLVRYVVVDRPGWRALPGAIWRDRWVWAPFAVVAVAFAWFFHTHYFGPQPTPSAGQLVGVFAYGMVRLWRGTVGVAIVPAQTWLRILSDVGVVATGLGVAFLCMRSRVVRRAAVLFVVYFVLKQTALGLGLAGKYGANYITSDPQYYIDLLVVAVLATALAASGGRTGDRAVRTPGPPAVAVAQTVSATSRSGGHGRHRKIGRRTSIGLMAGVLIGVGVHAVGTPFGLAHLVRANASVTQSRHYIDQLRHGLGAVSRSSTHASVVPMLLPGYVAPAFIAPYNRQDVFLRLVPEWKAFDSGLVMAIGDNGALIGVEAGQSQQLDPASPTVALAALTRRSSPTGETCFTGGAQPGTIVFNPPSSLKGPPLVLDVRVRTRQPFRAIPASAARGGWVFSPVSTGTSAGDHRLVTWLPGSAGSSIALTSITPFSSFCIRSVQVGVMTTTADRSGTCRSVATEGTVGSTTPCGRRWE